MTMRIETFLEQSPIFCVTLAARRFDALTARLLEADGLNFLEALILAALFFESQAAVKPSQLAETFGTTRGDPEDARAYHLALKPFGKKAAMRGIGALDKVQREFEKEIGKDALHSALQVIRSLGDSSPSRSDESR